ncbi:YgiT-type zinc finger protein [bacterium]|nr:YgiT-type zinc finger protein [bacterium]MBU1752535.1 YgiT-type zinc finger protein [bacterium]
MDKICNFCGNKNFNSKQIQYIYKHNNRFLIVNDVPCEECEYCGEKYFKSHTLKKIEEDFLSVYSGSKKSREMITVPVEEFAALTL